MLYNRQLVIADTFLKNRPNHGQILIEKPLYSGHVYSGYFYWELREYFGQNLPLNSGHYLISWEKRKHMHVFIRHISLFQHEGNFPDAIFHTGCNPCISIKNTLRVISSPNPTPQVTLFLVTSTHQIIC